LAYSVLADLQQQLGGAARLLQLLDWDGDGVIDPIREADALIDSFASKHFTVPFNPVPDTIRTTSAQLAIIIIRRRRMAQLSPADELRWEQLAGPNGWLDRLAAGVVTPGGDPLPPKHGTMEPDGATTQMSGDRELAGCKTSGFW